jgi:integrase
MTGIRRLITADGERISVLVDHFGMPFYDPNLFVTRNVRNASKSVSYVESHLRAIISVMAWEKDSGIDLKDRFSSGELLSELELESLTDFLSYRHETVEKLLDGVKLLPKAYKYKSSEVTYSTVGYVADYLDYLIKTHSPHPDRARTASEFKALIKKRRVRTRTHLNELEDKAMTEEEEFFVWDALDPNSPNNPWPRSEAVRVRNAIMFLVLYETGIRRGELGNVRIDDIDFRTRTLKIRRRQNSRSDPRVRQPNVKTRERSIPLSEDLSAQIEDYIATHRRCNKVARSQHNILFVSHQGKSMGQPLAVDSVNYVFRSLKKSIPALSEMHPHRLRHHANYLLSVTLDEAFKDLPLEERQKVDEQLRSQMFGWSSTGSQQGRYNKRYIQQMVREAMEKRNEKFSSVANKARLKRMTGNNSGEFK